MRIGAFALKRKQWEPVAFASPSLALIALVIGFPLVYAFTERRGLEKQKAAWGEKMAEMKALGIEYHPDWAAKAK